jgi:hypothetical protein
VENFLTNRALITFSRRTLLRGVSLHNRKHIESTCKALRVHCVAFLVQHRAKIIKIADFSEKNYAPFSLSILRRSAILKMLSPFHDLFPQASPYISRLKIDLLSTTPRSVACRHQIEANSQFRVPAALPEPNSLL